MDSNENISIPTARFMRLGARPVEIQKAIIDASRVERLNLKRSLLVCQRSWRCGHVWNSSPRAPAERRFSISSLAAAAPEARASTSGLLWSAKDTERRFRSGLLVDEPANNVYVCPQDTIYVYREPQTFVGFGASGTQGQFVDAWRISLAEAVAKMTGLTRCCDPASVFIYRGESCQMAEKLGVNMSKFNGL